MKKILCICFSSTFQRSINFRNISLNQVNRSESYLKYASGKAINSARVLEQLESNCVKCFCPLGEKDFSAFIELAKKDNLKIEYTLIPGNTRECWTLLDRENHTTTELVVSEPFIKKSEEIKNLEKETFNKIKSLILETDAVLLAGSRPAIWSNEIYPKIAEFAIKNEKIFLADYIGQDLQETLKITSPSIIKINDQEFCSTFMTENFEPENILFEQQLKNFVIQKSVEFNNIIVITRGTKSTFAAKSGTFMEIPIKKVNVVNTTACGDSFNAGFLHEYLNSKDLAKSLEKGTWCAAKNAESEAPGSIN